MGDHLPTSRGLELSSKSNGNVLVVVSEGKADIL
jgi:hypothetical protein